MKEQIIKRMGIRETDWTLSSRLVDWWSGIRLIDVTSLTKQHPAPPLEDILSKKKEKEEEEE